MENKVLLVIDDNELNMKLIRTMLQFKKYQILEAVNAQIGIQLAREHKPDLILMVQLPGLDGLAATRRIKAENALREIPIVAVNSYAMSGDKKKAIEAGCVGYITKPIDTRGFLETIARYLK